MAWSPAAVTAERLSFSYDNTTEVLRSVSFDVPAGSVFGVLGPNGSGKTTLFQLVLGLLDGPSGDLTVLDGSPTDRAIKARVGWVSSELPQALLLTLEEYFDLLRSTQPHFDMSFANRLLEPFGLADVRHRQVSALSHGMRKKAQLVGAMAHRPDLLLLDEPFSGLDPQSHFLLEETLLHLSRQGSTVIFASHQIDVVDRLTTHAAVLQDGVVCAAGATGQLRSSSPDGSLRSLYLSVTGSAADLDERSARLVDLISLQPA